MEIPRRLALRVGVFAAAALAIGFVVLMLVGGGGAFLSSSRTYHVAFNDVAGLREGAMVRLGGRVVGGVSEIDFGPLGGATDRALIVTFDVNEDFAPRVRADSRVSIGSQGLLGDKLLDVTLGSAAAPEAPDGSWLAGEPSTDPARLIGAATEAAVHARNVLARIDETTRELDTSGALDELSATAASLRRVVEHIESGPGLAHTVIYDERLAGNTSRAVASIERAADQGARAASDASKVMGRLEAVSAAVDPARVRRVVEDIGAITADVRAGRGTLGGLIADPTLYEETKRILINIRRNRVLRTVARLVISDSMPAEMMDANPKSVVVHPRPGPSERVNVSGKEAPGKPQPPPPKP